jgi:6-pyruvoyltetrahydropterin/6-carboxytetrahydropterin synthase
VRYGAHRYHDIAAGHRVFGHEGKCRNLHGHNYRVHFHCESEALDTVGRVVDFGVIKERLCQWLEFTWDHRFLVWENDPLLPPLRELDGTVVAVPFNPTAENMAHHLVTQVGPRQLAGTGVRLVAVIVEETARCRASFEIEDGD